MNAPSPVAANLKLYEKNTLRAFFDLELPSGMVLIGCTLHVKNDHWWVGLPGRSYTKDDGSSAWSNVVDFANKAARERFQTQATNAALIAFQRAGGCVEPDAERRKPA